MNIKVCNVVHSSTWKGVLEEMILGGGCKAGVLWKGVRLQAEPVRVKERGV